MSDGIRIEFGDQIRHRTHPEWGTGSVAKVEDSVAGGKPSQKVTIRFPNAGVKVIQSVSGTLERIDAEAPAFDDSSAADLIEEIDRMSQDDLLAPVANRKLVEIMVAIPESCRDPFRSLGDRIEATRPIFHIRCDSAVDFQGNWRREICSATCSCNLLQFVNILQPAPCSPGLLPSEFREICWFCNFL